MLAYVFGSFFLFLLFHRFYFVTTREEKKYSAVPLFGMIHGHHFGIRHTFWTRFKSPSVAPNGTHVPVKTTKKAIQTLSLKCDDEYGHASLVRMSVLSTAYKNRSKYEPPKSEPCSAGGTTLAKGWISVK